MKMRETDDLEIPQKKTILPSAVLVAAGQVPEGHGHGLVGQPLPVLGVHGIPLHAQPVLTVGVTPGHIDIQVDTLY